MLNNPVSICDPSILHFHPAMVLALLDGRKCCTTRTKRIGHAGDVFTVEGMSGVHFRIISVKELQLRSVRDYHYLEEGFNSPEEFEEFWKMTHKGYFRESRVYKVYRFASILNDLPVHVELGTNRNWEVDTRGD